MFDAAYFLGVLGRGPDTREQQWLLWTAFTYLLHPGGYLIYTWNADISIDALPPVLVHKEDLEALGFRVTRLRSIPWEHCFPWYHRGWKGRPLEGCENNLPDIWRHIKPSRAHIWRFGLGSG